MGKPGERGHLENLGVDEGVIFFCKLHLIMVYSVGIGAVVPSAATGLIRVLYSSFFV